MSAGSESIPSVDVQKFQGGSSWLRLFGVLGGLLTAISIVMAFIGGSAGAYSYLLGYAYWAGIGLGSLILLMIFHAFRAKWMVVIRRPLEAMATSAGLFLVLFIPIALTLRSIYKWVDPPADMGKEALELLHHKAPYLNPTFFIVRTVIFFIVAMFLAGRFFGWSVRQDETGDLGLTQKARSLGAGALPLMALVFSFAAFDWLMSLEPLWFSTIFGVYYFAGSFLGTFALLIIASLRARGKDLFGTYVSPEHLHNLGKLLFAFTAFWAYIAVSQLLLIWIAGLPEETPFFLVRFEGHWPPVGLLLIFGHFLLPFFILLSRDLKRRPNLIMVAVWALFIHYVDLYWLVVPNFSAEGPTFHLNMLTSFFGIGCLSVAFVIWRLRGRYTVPVKDPFLAVSLRYRQP